MEPLSPDLRIIFLAQEIISCEGCRSALLKGTLAKSQSLALELQSRSCSRAQLILTMEAFLVASCIPDPVESTIRTDL